MVAIVVTSSPSSISKPSVAYSIFSLSAPATDVPERRRFVNFVNMNKNEERGNEET